MLDRVKNKLAGWKASLLSMVGRKVLILASSSVISAYVMQSNLLPNKVLDGIDRVNRNFLWGSVENKRKMHWVGWNKVTRPKEEGGLGLQTTKGRNTALLAKLSWRFHTEDKASWAKVLRPKYCNHQRLNSRNVDKLPSSRMWKGLLKGEETFRKGTKWLSGFENKMAFWYDNWSNLGPLRNIIHGPLTLESSKLKIKDVADYTGSWNWSIIQMELPEDFISELKATPIPLSSRLEDRLVWKCSPKGAFDLKSAYGLATEPMRVIPFKGSWIWQLKILPRIQAFVWKCMHHSIGINQCLLARGMQIEPNCPRCHREVESILHALRDCPLSKSVWY